VRAVTTSQITGYFVTGTDTNVGKTTVSCALLHEFARRGHTTVGMKPVAAGRENGVWQDVINLQQASNITPPQALVNPYALTAPIAPHLSASQDGVHIELAVIRQAYDGLRAQAQIVIVEGAGGFLVPLNDEHDTGDLAKLLELPVILVIGMRLGCLNHALLSTHAIRAKGLVLAGWVANQLEPDMLCLAENIDALRMRIPAPLLGVLPFLPSAGVEKFAGLLRLP